MRSRPFVLPDFTHLKVRITGKMDLQGARPDPWLAPVLRLDATMGLGEAAWIAARPETVLAFHLSGADVRCCFGQHEGRVSAPSARLTLQPTGTPARFRADGPSRFAQFYLADGLLDRAAAVMNVSPLSGRLRDDLIFASDQVLHERVARHLSRAFDPEEPPSVLEMEGRTLLVLERLVKLHAGKPVEPIRGGLAPWQLRRTTECLAQRLSEEVGLGELAALVDLSPFHFARAFKASTGLPPHQYQMRLRVERARELLAATSLPIGEVAAAVGYDAPQSLARLFRRELGTTPSQYRRRMER